MKNTSKKKLEKREQQFLELIDKKDRKAILLFALLRIHYYIDDLVYNRNHSKLIDSVYVKRLNLAKWSQANNCNIGERTSFRYRNEYVDLINSLYEEKLDYLIFFIEEILEKNFDIIFTSQINKNISQK